MPVPYCRQPCTFQFDGFTVTLTRLTDREFVRLRRRSIAIAEDGLFLIRLGMAAAERDEDLNFAEVHYVLQRHFGRSGHYFDNWKGSFSFPFSLTVCRADRSYLYSLNIHNHRSSLEFALRRIVDSPALIDNIIHPPVADEFSRTDMNAFIAFLYGYLRGYLESLLKRRPRIRPFLYRVESNLILYGYQGGAFFENHYRDEAAFNAASNDFKAGHQVADKQH